MTTNKNKNLLKKSNNSNFQKNNLFYNNNINNNFPIKIESIKKNNNIINNEKSKKKFIMNTYKTFSDISTKPNETQKINTTLNSTYKKNKNYYEYETNYLIIEETFNTYRESHNNSNSKNSKYSKSSKSKELEIRTEEGLFNGDILYFDENGLKYGLRGKKDGYGFFGTSTHYHGKIINDYVLNISNVFKKNSSGLRKNSNFSSKTYSLTNEDNNNIPIIYFVIYYEKETKKFFLKNV